MTGSDDLAGSPQPAPGTPAGPVPPPGSVPPLRQPGPPPYAYAAPYPPAYAQPYWPPPVAAAPSQPSGALATAAGVLGIVGLAMAVIPALYWFLYELTAIDAQTYNGVSGVNALLGLDFVVATLALVFGAVSLVREGPKGVGRGLARVRAGARHLRPGDGDRLPAAGHHGRQRRLLSGRRRLLILSGG